MTTVMLPFDDEPVLHSPGLAHASPLDLMCARFALRAVLSLGPRFNLRRDINNIVTLTGRWLVWPRATFVKLQTYVARRCHEAPAWAGAAGRVHGAIRQLERAL